MALPCTNPELPATLRERAEQASLSRDELRCWQMIYTSFLTTGRAPDMGGLDADAIEKLIHYDIIALSDDESLAAYPFAGYASPHTVRIPATGASVHALCAVDALGIFFVTRSPIVITSACAHSGREISISVDGEQADQLTADPTEALVFIPDIARRRSTAQDCCPQMAFLSSADDLRRWRAVHGLSGKSYTILEALQGPAKRSFDGLPVGTVGKD